MCLYMCYHLYFICVVIYVFVSFICVIHTCGNFICVASFIRCCKDKQRCIFNTWKSKLTKVLVVIKYLLLFTSNDAVCHVKILKANQKSLSILSKVSNDKVAKKVQQTL